MRQKASWVVYALACVGYVVIDILSWVLAKFFLFIITVPLTHSAIEQSIASLVNTIPTNLIITIFVVAFGGLMGGLSVWLRLKSVSKLYEHDLMIHLGLAILTALAISAIAINL